MDKIDYSLYLVTDSNLFVDDTALLFATEQALKSGVTLVQLREKNLTSIEFYRLAIKMRDLTAKYSRPLIINDRLDIALATAADGIHLGQSDLPADATRKIVSKDFIIGVSAKTLEQALIAEVAGADYLGVGAIFPTTTKVITKPTSIATLKNIVQTVKIPVVAIGGINVANLDSLIASEISGIAVVSAILTAKNIGQTVTQLKSKVALIKNNL